MPRDPRDQFAAIGATALVDALIARLEARGVLAPDDRETVLDEALAALRQGGEPSRMAARYLEGAFNLRPPAGRQRPAPPRRRPR